MGMSYQDYANTTYYNFILKQRGFLNKESKEWQRTRVLGYTIYCANSDSKDRASIYEWMPLDTDPSPKERERAEKRAIEKEIREHEKAYKKYFG